MSLTIYDNSSYSDIPLGLKLQQTITSSGSVVIPSNIKRVYAVCIGGGGSGGHGFSFPGGGGAGGFSAGWTFATDICTVGAGGAGVSVGGNGINGGATRYGMVFAAGGGAGASSGAGGSGGGASIAGGVSYTGALAGNPGYAASGGATNSAGGVGVSGGGGGGTGNSGNGPAGGAGLIGGGGSSPVRAADCFGGVGGAGDYFAAGAGGTYFAVTGTITNAVGQGTASGISITAITDSSPSAGFVTYSTASTAVLAGASVTISGATPAGYNGTFTVVSAVSGVSFTVANATTGAATGTIIFSYTGPVTYTSTNSINTLGRNLNISGITPTAFNLSGQNVTSATATQFTVANAATGTYVSGGSFISVQTAGGGGGGGFRGAGVAGATTTGPGTDRSGGNGGDGGGGGGSCGGLGTSGTGGNGVIYLYY